MPTTPKDLLWYINSESVYDNDFPRVYPSPQDIFKELSDIISTFTGLSRRNIVIGNADIPVGDELYAAIYLYESDRENEGVTDYEIITKDHRLYLENPEYLNKVLVVTSQAREDKFSVQFFRDQNIDTEFILVGKGNIPSKIIYPTELDGVTDIPLTIGDSNFSISLHTDVSKIAAEMQKKLREVLPAEYKTFLYVLYREKTGSLVIQGLPKDYEVIEGPHDNSRLFLRTIGFYPIEDVRVVRPGRMQYYDIGFLFHVILTTPKLTETYFTSKGLTIEQIKPFMVINRIVSQRWESRTLVEFCLKYHIVLEYLVNNMDIGDIFLRGSTRGDPVYKGDTLENRESLTEAGQSDKELPNYYTEEIPKNIVGEENLGT